MKIRVWGARGSHPISGAEFSKVGGNTSCVEVRAGKHVIILDAGTGIINLGNLLLQEHFATGDSPFNRDPINLTLLFSHMHYDHNQGFPFFKPAYMPVTNLHIYGPKFFGKELIDILQGVMTAPYFPVELEDLMSTRNVQSIRESQVLLLAADHEPLVLKKFKQHKEVAAFVDKYGQSDDFVRIDVLKCYAHPGGTLIYKISHQSRSVVYVSDTEGYLHGDQRLINFSRNVDVLIHDAQYTPEHYCGGPVPTQGWGHSTYEMACDVAKQAEVKRLLLFHHDPSYNDSKIESIIKQARPLFKNTDYAHEGMEIDL